MVELLKIENLEKSFGNNKVLRDISLSVTEGEVLAIIGPSGGGKSTLLRCAVMLEKADSGSIKYLDKYEVIGADNKTSAEIRRCFGLVFQDFNLFPHFSVLKNITEAPVHVQKIPVKEAEKTARELLVKMGLSDKADAYPCELSGGQQQRVSIARALALNPKILFFDEPTSALDPELTGDILKVIRDLAKDHMTMVIVTHEMNFAKEVADYIVFMDKGVVAEEGYAADVISNPQTERLKGFLNKLNEN